MGMKDAGPTVAVTIFWVLITLELSVFALLGWVAFECSR